MNLTNQQDRLNEYKEKVWNWQGKETKLKNMNIGQLEQCLKYIKNSRFKKVIFGEDKQYWLNAIPNMIKERSNNNINYITRKLLEIRVNTIRKQVDIYLLKNNLTKITLNKTKEFKIV